MTDLTDKYPAALLDAETQEWFDLTCECLLRGTHEWIAGVARPDYKTATDVANALMLMTRAAAKSGWFFEMCALAEEHGLNLQHLAELCPRDYACRQAEEMAAE